MEALLQQLAAVMEEPLHCRGAVFSALLQALSPLAILLELAQLHLQLHATPVVLQDTKALQQQLVAQQEGIGRSQGAR
jgi:hypothetical protein